MNNRDRLCRHQRSSTRTAAIAAHLFHARPALGKARLAGRAGIASEHLVLDPGFGFGKRFDENYPLLAHLAVFAQLGYPLLVGTSRKAFIGRTVASRLAELGVWHPTAEVPMLPPFVLETVDHTMR